MREEEFKNWLSERGISQNSINTRSYAIRTIDKKLEALGWPDATIDDLVTEGEIQQLKEKLGALKAEAKSGGTKFRILLPESENPDTRLSSWMSWVGQYEQFANDLSSASETDFAERYKLWDEFLDTWPLDRLKKLTLTDYTAAGSKDTLTYWLEARLSGLGSIWGGSAFKFGVFSRASNEAKPSNDSYSYDANYGWNSGLGDSAEEAFNQVKEALLGVYQAARTDDTLAIENEKRIWQVVAWKMAFHYQDRQSPKIVNIFKRDWLIDHLGLQNKSTPRHQLYAALLPKKQPNEGILEFGHRIWAEMEKSHGDAEEKEAETELTNNELLARFDGDPRFRKHRNSWTEEQSGAFCRMARAIHKVGLDWYHTNIPEIRFGRKIEDGRDAVGTLGSLQIRKKGGFVQFSHQHHQLNLTGSFAIDDESARDFASIVGSAQDDLASWQPLDVERPGRWPDEYKGTGPVNPINLILYGPPGTGKTYETMTHAVRLCGDEPEDSRDALRTQYERLRDEEKRIEFVTFHQNFAYEEFVEGLRPQMQSGDETGEAAGGFNLEPVAGIFRKLCARADEARKSPRDGPTLNLEGRKVFKMSLGRAGLEDEIFEEAWDGNYIVLGWGGEVDWSGFDSFRSIHDRWNQDHPGTHGSDSNIAQVNRFVVDMKPGDIVVVSYGNSKIRAIAEITGQYEFAPTTTRDYNHRRDVRWLRRFDIPIDASIISSANFSQKSCYLIQETNLDRAGLATLIPQDNKADSAPEQYVLVVDEINRANISKVFGELITLIEPDKRLGMEEELVVRLPYSKERFGVPANLHIIGTMNTADRSIMQIDTALRRRFRFEEMEPNSDLLEPVSDIDLPRVLSTINTRIEYLLDRDHSVGHAFFMGSSGSDRSSIDDTMRFKIIPLLQEYFFDDWRNIAAVLGKGFVRGETLPVPPGIEDRGERTRWTIRWREKDQSGFPEDAYDLLLKGSEAEIDGADELGSAAELDADE